MYLSCLTIFKIPQNSLINFQHTILIIIQFKYVVLFRLLFKLIVILNFNINLIILHDHLTINPYNDILF